MDEIHPRYAILEAPSILGLKPSGVELLPEALLQHGLAQAPGALRAGRLAPPAYDATRDAEHGLLNTQGIAAYTASLADAVGAIRARSELPIVLGGDCSIVLGTLLALRREGRYGLLFIDGHTDFYQPEANINGEVASSDLALATGHGPEALTCFEGLSPLVRAEDVVAFGHRDGEEQRKYGCQPLPAELRAFDLEQARALGIEVAAQHAIAHLTRNALEGFWIHLDADVLDDEVMPAVDYRTPGGLTHAELATLLRVAFASPLAVGLEVTIYNPTLDPSGEAGKALTQTLFDALAARYVTSASSRR
jgi:arginase